jgi:hypothetical protein
VHSLRSSGDFVDFGYFEIEPRDLEEENLAIMLGTLFVEALVLSLLSVLVVLLGIFFYFAKAPRNQRRRSALTDGIVGMALTFLITMLNTHLLLGLYLSAVQPRLERSQLGMAIMEANEWLIPWGYLLGVLVLGFAGGWALGRLRSSDRR